MARHVTVFLSAIFLASVVCAAHASGSSDPSQSSVKQTWRACHDAMASKLQAVRHNLQLPADKQMFVDHQDESMESQAFHTPTKEGVACTWQALYFGIEFCYANWKQLNKTLTPANEVARASTNILAKNYMCGLLKTQDSCAGVPHCKWANQFSVCGLSNFFVTLQYSCHDSPVRRASICIDYTEGACNADARCKWHAFADSPEADVCLPASAPADWTEEQIGQWLTNLFHKEESYWTNWGDCATSHALAEVSACANSATEEGCVKDEDCMWSAPYNACTLKPGRAESIMWGGDLKTLQQVLDRQSYCAGFGTRHDCVHALPLAFSRRMLAAL